MCGLRHPRDAVPFPVPNGVTLGLAVTGEVVSIDKDGKRTPLDNPDAIKTLWFDVSDTWPEPPRIPHDPVLTQQVAEAQAAIEASKPHDFKATRDAEGNITLTLDDGTKATIAAA